MKALITVLLALKLVACASYKIVPQGDIKPVSGPEAELVVEREQGWQKGLQCGTPIYHVISLGIVPKHCVDVYSVREGDDRLGNVKVISMQGWIPLFMWPSPTWNYGFGDDVNDEIIELVNPAPEEDDEEVTDTPEA